MAMAKISNIPKVGEFVILDLNRSQIDLQVTQVRADHTLDGHSKIVIEGFPHRERAMEHTGVSGYAAGSSFTVPSYQTIGITPNTVSFDVGVDFAKKDLARSKGMDVDINTIETVDGTKAQIVLYAGSKKVIAWESEAFEDDEDLSAKGAQTADVKAKKAAEGHAKGVLKAVFSQS